MVSIKSILKCHGVHEWLLVRMSAIWILLYIIYISIFIIFSNNLSYDQWYDFFSKKTTKIFSIITLLSALSHAWIGMRHILEDYITLPVLRQLGIWVTGSILCVYLFFGIIIIWSI
ncbi:succinate dehydrogenase, hydrophobic membrane anchor protein [Blochmannia endosymbiont of Camponotus sp. C-003]|uniref:succinate dehydrogenase, hydrophobic membrane anchor protein n=1 Tax=unclassified Candidatus Blochmanniella TaxID=711328 RepID=UPI002024DF16|nr:MULTISPECIES: succinate dehydrogenase, hydrophobic membrane anchor protein [unclassified Candidatus Blochmannia]URJ23484.1 succinate dehydrogenase, hydrophobic membrane anchor protein [Blochmannia endosymbiont of Camponotus sp. C-003]URJ28956.1 succinate dehydrogenase, hydrophobic membrane anchor protein [Blochmannia endosymbiont of Camponotus sp. C-046]